jgi:hypothetical protein
MEVSQAGGLGIVVTRLEPSDCVAFYTVFNYLYFYNGFIRRRSAPAEWQLLPGLRPQSVTNYNKKALHKICRAP